MFDFTIMVRSVDNTKTQQIKSELVDKLIARLSEQFDPTNVKEPPKPLTQKAIDEVIDVQKKLKLETGDGALAMLSKTLFS